MTGTTTAQIVDSGNPYRPIGIQYSSAPRSRFPLLAIATAATLTFGWRPVDPLMSFTCFLFRASGAACAIVTLRREPKARLFDPVAEARATYEFQLKRVNEEHKVALQVQALTLQQQYEAHYNEQLQSTISYYTLLLQQKERHLLEVRQEAALQLAEAKAKEEHIGQAWQRQWEQLEVQAAELEATKNQLRAEKEALHAWADEQAVEQENIYREKMGRVEERASKLEAHLNEQRQAMIAQFEQQYDELLAVNQQRIDEYKKVIADLEATVETQKLYIYNLQKPELLNGASTYELSADRVIEFLYEHGVIVRSPRIVPYDKKFELSFSILPIVPGKNDKGKYAESLLDAYRRIQDRLADGVPAVVPHCKSKPKVDIANNRISLSIDVSGIDWEAVNRIDPIVEADPDWLLVLAETSNHFRITGESDSGKSTLMDNLIGAMQRVWDGLRLSLADPKYPFTEWTTFEPTYKSTEGAFKGVSALEKLIDNRFVLATKEKEAGRGIPEFQPELFVLDEAEWLIDEARAIDESQPPKRGQVSLQRHLTRMLRKGLKVGRGLTKRRGRGLKVAYIAQSPLCSRLGLNRDDFDQSTNIFIGENIPRAIEEELKNKLSTEDKLFWKEQYHLRIARGDKYFCFVKAPGKRPFMAFMPPPGHYALSSITTNELSHPDNRVQLDRILEVEELDDLGLVAQEEEELTADQKRLEDIYQAPDLTQLPEGGLELLGYAYGKGSRYAEEGGWFSVAKLRDNWGRNRGYNTDQLKVLLEALTAIGAGSFANTDKTLWKPVVDPRFLPKSNS